MSRDHDQGEYPSRMTRVRFDGTITAGNIMTAVPLIFMLVAWGVRLEARVDHQFDLMARLERAAEQETARNAAHLDEIKRLIGSINSKLDSYIQNDVARRREGGR